MDRYPMPYDKESSKEILGKFMENAMNIKLKNHFLKAIDFVFGKSFEVRLDLSRRMCFFCLVCTKEMNSVKALQEHSASGNHIKNEDMKRQDERPSMKYEPYWNECRSYETDSLQYKLQQARIDIVGLQFLEGYSSGSRTYFKCNLCGAHGKADAMYNHVIGNSHTDRYIKIRIAMRNPVIDAETRQYLRKILCEKERTSVNDIAIIKGSEFYPRMWEQETQRSRSKSKKRDVEFRFDEIKTIKQEFEREKPAIKETKDVKLQCISYSYFNQILMKCNMIVKAHLDESTDLKLEEDVRMALNLLYYILYLLHYALKGTLEDADGSSKYEDLVKRSKTVSYCLSFLHKRIIPSFENRHH